MSVVVSDTSPLHYLILCGEESVLPRLFSQVVIPPTVFRELQQPNAPPLVREWLEFSPHRPANRILDRTLLGFSWIFGFRLLRKSPSQYQDQHHRGLDFPFRLRAGALSLK